MCPVSHDTQELSSGYLQCCYESSNPNRFCLMACEFHQSTAELLEILKINVSGDMLQCTAFKLHVFLTYIFSVMQQNKIYRQLDLL